jgi:hypothetical protein
MSDGDNSEFEPGRSDSDGGSKRRRFLQLASTASVGALVGCIGSESGGHEGEAAAGRADDWCVEENNVEVPDALKTAESVDGIERNPDELNTREEAAYQCYPSGYQLCANCRFFIPAKPDEADTGDAGACAIVEGLVRSRDWCALYRPNNDLESFPSPVALDEPGQQKAPDVTLNESDAN